MPDISEVLSFSEAAEKKGCARSTLYRAAHDDRIHTVQVGTRTMIVQDDAWTFFEPQDVGRRVQNQSSE